MPAMIPDLQSVLGADKWRRIAQLVKSGALAPTDQTGPTVAGATAPAGLPAGQTPYPDVTTGQASTDPMRRIAELFKPAALATPSQTGPIRSPDVGGTMAPEAKAKPKFGNFKNPWTVIASLAPLLFLKGGARASAGRAVAGAAQGYAQGKLARQQADESFKRDVDLARVRNEPAMAGLAIQRDEAEAARQFREWQKGMSEREFAHSQDDADYDRAMNEARLNTRPGGMVNGVFVPGTIKSVQRSAHGDWETVDTGAPVPQNPGDWAAIDEYQNITIPKYHAEQKLLTEGWTGTVMDAKGKPITITLPPMNTPGYQFAVQHYQKLLGMDLDLALAKAMNDVQFEAWKKQNAIEFGQEKTLAGMRASRGGGKEPFDVGETALKSMTPGTLEFQRRFGSPPTAAETKIGREDAARDNLFIDQVVTWRTSPWFDINPGWGTDKRRPYAAQMLEWLDRPILDSKKNVVGTNFDSVVAKYGAENASLLKGMLTRTGKDSGGNERPLWDLMPGKTPGKVRGNLQRALAAMRG